MTQMILNTPRLMRPNAAIPACPPVLAVLRGALLIALALLLPPSAAAQTSGHQVVLVTLDGARHQEIFGGLDVSILESMTGNQPVAKHPAYARYWAATPDERRRKLMPFFWNTLMAQGSIAGNRTLGSQATVTNGHHFSYPGYSEILTGEARDQEIASNDLKQNPYETVLEFVRRKLNLPKAKVAAFTSWNVFSGIAEHTPGAITINAGVSPFAGPEPEATLLNALQDEARAPWDGIRHDAFTFRMAMAYLKRERPRLLYIALDETDDWAHDGKYDLVLDSLARTDRQLEQLWTWILSDPEYRNNTTLIITTDHGRGRTRADWRSHGSKIPGADEIWIAVVSPTSTRRGEWAQSPPVFQNQVAATIAAFFGLDLRELRPTAGAPLPLTSLAQAP